jgi:hypothetical protein
LLLLAVRCTTVANNKSADMHQLGLCSQEEVRDMAKKCYAAGLQLLVIDTENKFVSTGFAEEIAKAANGKYYYLPNANDAAIAMAASSAMVSDPCARVLRQGCIFQTCICCTAS